jgi:hypothetical protein
MAILLMPGRHLVNTRFQESYLRDHLPVPVENLPVVGAKTCRGMIDEVVFAITSANQAHSRYNPIPLEVRAIGVDRLARRLREAFGVRCRIVPVPHYGPTVHFAEFLVKEMAEATEGDLVVTPENAIVLTSTPEVIDQFVALGYGVMPGELASREPAQYAVPTPIEVLKKAVAAGEDWEADAGVREDLSEATASVWRDFPDVLRRVVRLYRDPLLTESGSLTETRNYSTYAVGMGHKALLEVKYQDVRQAIVPGRIVDEGCADGALLVPIARDFPDSDLIGIEITGEFMARCLERQRAMEYGGTYIHFHQRNITEPIFETGSIDTTLCNSTTHELWSYGRQAETLRPYLREKWRQTRKGGRLIIRDVVGPENQEEVVWLWCHADDGQNEDIHKQCGSAGELQRHLTALSTAARFERFATDYLAENRASGQRRAECRIHYEAVVREGRRLFKMRLADAMEFLLKKDYVDNWASELHEEFCFWSFAQWKRELTKAGFKVVEDPNEPAKGSRAYTSRWIVENRLAGKAELFRTEGEKLVRAEYPATNMVLVGEK